MTNKKKLHELSLRTLKIVNDKTISDLARSKGHEEIRKEAQADNICVNEIFCYVSQNQDQLSKELEPKTAA